MKSLSTSKAIKSISTKKYEVSLMERTSGSYYVQYSGYDNKFHYTDDLKDYGVASHLFSLLLAEVQGH